MWSRPNRSAMTNHMGGSDWNIMLSLKDVGVWVSLWENAHGGWQVIKAAGSRGSSFRCIKSSVSSIFFCNCSFFKGNMKSIEQDSPSTPKFQTLVILGCVYLWYLPLILCLLQLLLSLLVRALISNLGTSASKIEVGEPILETSDCV